MQMQLDIDKHSNQDTPSPRWVCERCDELLGQDDGVVVTSLGSIGQWERSYPVWDRAGKASLSIEVVSVKAYPSVVRWHVVHDECGGSDSVSAPYAIRVGELQTWRDVALMTSRLLAGPWIGATNWGDVIRSASKDHA